mmetsp:Transcript_19650/g.61740  ORF Transcript_19650/g.61740 Transcript_19650/m.61740 type:complete len:291 (+) Transcript_19650:37-909(+)
MGGLPPSRPRHHFKSLACEGLKLRPQRMQRATTSGRPANCSGLACPHQGQSLNTGDMSATAPDSKALSPEACDTPSRKRVEANTPSSTLQRTCKGALSKYAEGAWRSPCQSLERGRERGRRLRGRDGGPAAWPAPGLPPRPAFLGLTSPPGGLAVWPPLEAMRALSRSTSGSGERPGEGSRAFHASTAICNCRAEAAEVSVGAAAFPRGSLRWERKRGLVGGLGLASAPLARRPILSWAGGGESARLLEAAFAPQELAAGCSCLLLEAALATQDPESGCSCSARSKAAET